MNDQSRKILLVDDEEDFRLRLQKAFIRRGFTVFGAEGFDAALAVMIAERPGMAVIDLRMPGRSGLELVTAAGRIHPGMAIVVLTGYGSIATATEAIRMGAVAYLPKPADADEILRAFNREPGHPRETPEEVFPAPSLARAEWEHINRVLADCGGNISRAAQCLGLHRRTLQRKLQKFPPRE